MKFGLILFVSLLVILCIGVGWLVLTDPPVQQQEIIVNVPVGAQ